MSEFITSYSPHAIDKKITYFKPGMGLGGATFADIHLLHLSQELGTEVNVVTGYVLPHIKDCVRSQLRVSVQVREPLDRHYHAETGKALQRQILDIINEYSASDVLIFSQPYSGDAPDFAEAVSQVTIPTSWHRVHDPVRTHAAYARLRSTHHTSLPTTEILKQQMEKVNQHVNTIVLPECIDSEKLNKRKSRRMVRIEYGFSEDDIVFAQPTRVAQNKRVDKALLLASAIEKKYKYINQSKKVFLLVGGGNESSEQAIEVKHFLMTLAAKLDFQNLIFLNGKGKMEDIIGAADTVTFMSEVEAWGIPPAEAAYLGVPCVVSPYTDADDGNDVFESVYAGFSFIKEGIGLNGISQSTVDEVMEYLTCPELWSRKIEQNKLTVEKYTSKTMKKTLQALLRRK